MFRLSGRTRTSWAAKRRKTERNLGKKVAAKTNWPESAKTAREKTARPDDAQIRERSAGANLNGRFEVVGVDHLLQRYVNVLGKGGLSKRTVKIPTAYSACAAAPNETPSL